MMKIVQRVAKWSTAVAVALSLSGSAKAATLAEIVSTLGTSGYTLTQVSPTEAKQAFITTGPVGLYVIESNQNTSFGFERNGTNNVISVQKGFTSGDKKGFDVFGGVAGPNPLTVITNPTATVFSQDSTSNAADTGIVGSKKLDASVVGNGPFHFTLRLSPGFSGANNDGGPSNTLSNLGQSTVLNTGSNTPYGTFTQYKISGDSESKYNDSYLIAYTYNEGQSNGYTFAAIVSGVVNPEPASIAMLATGVFGLIGYRARRRRQSAEATQVV